MNKKILVVSLVLLTLTLVGCPRDVPIDIMPGSYPNPVNVHSKGMISVAVLGTEDLEVSAIEPTSFAYPEYGISNVRWHYEDVSTPGNPTAGPDGYTDLVLQYDREEVYRAAVALGEIPEDGTVLPVTVIGKLKDGTEIWGTDDIVVINKGRR